MEGVRFSCDVPTVDEELLKLADEEAKGEVATVEDSEADEIITSSDSIANFWAAFVFCFRRCRSNHMRKKRS